MSNVEDHTNDWDLNSGTALAGPLALPPPFTGWVNPLVITPGGQSAVYTPDDSVPLVIDLERGVVLTRFSPHSGPVLSLAVTPDGRAALSSSRDETILWELATGAVLAGPWYGWRLYSLAITPDGTRFVAGTWEGTIVIAQLADGAVLARFTGESPVTYCAVADDGRTILAAERSGRVHWLRLEEPERG
jgi:WD40 repeat protein